MLLRHLSLWAAFLLTAGFSLASATAAAEDKAQPTAGRPDLCLRPPESESQSADKPAAVGVYLSLGYWQTKQVDAVFPELAAHGVNLVIDYALAPPEDENWTDEFQHYMNTAEANGIGVAFVLYPALKGMTPLTARAYFDNTVQQVRLLKGYSAIKAWYVHDEVLPWLTDKPGKHNYIITLNGMRNLYQMIAEEDPSRPQLCVWNHLPTFEQFHNAYNGNNTPNGMPKFYDDPQRYEQALRDVLQQTCDIVLIDSYPVGAPWREDEQPPKDVVQQVVARAALLKAPEQPLYIVFQAFSWAQYNHERIASSPFPTRGQMQEMVAAAHGAGASGAIAYSWFDLTEDGIDGRDIPGRLQAVEDLSAVLSALAREGWPATAAPNGPES